MSKPLHYLLNPLEIGIPAVFVEIIAYLYYCNEKNADSNWVLECCYRIDCSYGNEYGILFSRGSPDRRSFSPRGVSSAFFLFQDVVQATQVCAGGCLVPDSRHSRSGDSIGGVCKYCNNPYAKDYAMVIRRVLQNTFQPYIHRNDSLVAYSRRCRTFNISWQTVPGQTVSGTICFRAQSGITS